MATLTTKEPLKPFGMVTTSSPTRPAQLPCVYLTVTSKPFGRYVLDLEEAEDRERRALAAVRVSRGGPHGGKAAALLTEGTVSSSRQ